MRVGPSSTCSPLPALSRSCLTQSRDPINKGSLEWVKKQCCVTGVPLPIIGTDIIAYRSYGLSLRARRVYQFFLLLWLMFFMFCFRNHFLFQGTFRFVVRHLSLFLWCNVKRIVCLFPTWLLECPENESYVFSFLCPPNQPFSYPNTHLYWVHSKCPGHSSRLWHDGWHTVFVR